MKQVRTRPEIVITNDVYLRQRGLIDPADESMLAPGALVLTLPEAVARLHADGHHDAAKDLAAQVPSTPPGREQIYLQLQPGDAEDMVARANVVMREFEALAAVLVQIRRAQWIRTLRCEQRHSWRALAHECHRAWLGASWSPPENQIMGIALCERAAHLLGEDPHTMPWNDL